MKYYIATKLENHLAHNQLRDQLQEQGHEITYDWTTHNAVYREGLARIKEVIDLEIQGVLAADTVIVLWPGGRGTHVELGIAIAAKKNIIFMSPIENHHRASPEICGFYRCCFCVKSIKEVLEITDLQ